MAGRSAISVISERLGQLRFGRGEFLALLVFLHVYCSVLINIGYMVQVGMWSGYLFTLSDVFQIDLYLAYGPLTAAMFLFLVAFFRVYLESFLFLIFGRELVRRSAARLASQVRENGLLRRLFGFRFGYFLIISYSAFLVYELQKLDSSSDVTLSQLNAVLSFFALSFFVLLGLNVIRDRGVALLSDIGFMAVLIAIYCVHSGAQWARYDIAAGDLNFQYVTTEQGCRAMTVLRVVAGGLIFHDTISRTIEYVTFDHLKGISSGRPCPVQAHPEARDP